jgi:iron complex transport system permease protein
LKKFTLVSGFLLLLGTLVLCGFDLGPDPASVFLNFRLPRLLGAVSAGIISFLSGIILQTLFLNPIVDSAVLGIASSASLGAVLMGFTFAGSYAFSVPFGAIIGVSGATALILQASYKVRSSNSLLLVGIALGTFTSAGTVLALTFLNPEQSGSLLQWILGDCSRVTTLQGAALLAISCAALVWCLLHATALDQMMFGEQHAVTFGLNVRSLRLQGIAMACVATGLLVAWVGVIAFVGVLIPHFTRRFVGQRHRSLIFSGAVAAAACVVVADGISLVSGYYRSELPLGALLAVIGAPLFAFVLLRMGKVS